MSSLGGANQYGQNGFLAQPGLQDAIGVLAASGPSRMPTNLGQVLAEGEMTSNQNRLSGMQNLFQGIALQRQLDYLRALSGGIPNTGTSSTPGAPAPQPGSSQGQNSDTPQTDGNPLFMDSSQYLAAPTHAPEVTSGGGSSPSGLGAAASGGGGGGAQPASGLASSLGVPSDDPILRDPTVQRDLALANAAPDAATQGQWLTRARLDYDMRAGTPEYKARVESAVNAADLPYKVRESLAGQLGRVTSIKPGEGEIAVSGLSLADPKFLDWLTGGGLGGAGGSGSGAGGTQPAPTPGLGGASQSSGAGAAAPGAGTATTITPRANMSGVPTPMVNTPGGVNTQQAVYNTALQKELASQDAKYLGELQTSGDAATAGRQNVEEMWQSLNSGIFTGKFADFKESFLKGADALGVPLSDELQAKLTGTEAFTKNQAQLGIQLAKSVSSRPSQFEFKYLNGNAVANPELQKASIPLLLGQMEGNQIYAQQKAAYVTAQVAKGVNPRQAALQFDVNGSSMPYVLQALAARDPGTYQKLRQQMNSDATGKAFANQVEKEAAWMKKNGTLVNPFANDTQAAPSVQIPAAAGGAQ